MTTDPRIRAGDEDRDHVAAQLREHFAAGRISGDELQERLDATYQARTFGDLNPLLADLPELTNPPAPRAPQASPEPATGPASTAPAPARRSGPSTALRAVWTAWFMAVSINVVIWLIVSISTGELIYFWPIWVAGPWGAVLIAGTIANRYGTGSDQDRLERRRRWEQRQIERRDRRRGGGGGELQ